MRMKICDVRVSLLPVLVLVWLHQPALGDDVAPCPNPPQHNCLIDEAHQIVDKLVPADQRDGVLKEIAEIEAGAKDTTNADATIAKIKDLVAIAATHSSVAQIFASLGMPDAASAHFLEALKYRDLLTDDLTWITTTTGIASDEQLAGWPDDAKTHYNEATGRIEKLATYDDRLKAVGIILAGMSAASRFDLAMDVLGAAKLKLEHDIDFRIRFGRWSMFAGDHAHTSAIFKTVLSDVGGISSPSARVQILLQIVDIESVSSNPDTHNVATALQLAWASALGGTDADRQSVALAYGLAGEQALALEVANTFPDESDTRGRVYGEMVCRLARERRILRALRLAGEIRADYRRVTAFRDIVIAQAGMGRPRDALYTLGGVPLPIEEAIGLHHISRAFLALKDPDLNSAANASEAIKSTNDTSRIERVRAKSEVGVAYLKAKLLQEGTHLVQSALDSARHDFAYQGEEKPRALRHMAELISDSAPLTDDFPDPASILAEAFASASGIPYEDRRNLALAEVAGSQVRIGDVGGAVTSADAMTASVDKNRLLLRLIAIYLNGHAFDEAYTLARKVGTDGSPEMARALIVVIAAEAGTLVSNNLVHALTEARGLYPSMRAIALVKIAVLLPSQS